METNQSNDQALATPAKDSTFEGGENGRLPAAPCSANSGVSEEQSSERFVVIDQKAEGLSFSVYGGVTEFDISKNVLTRML